MSTVRENYHSQMETIRNSYLESADRFRGYKQAQMDNVQQHLDIYYQQVYFFNTKPMGWDQVCRGCKKFSGTSFGLLKKL
jgi:hypothetical protein